MFLPTIKTLLRNSLLKKGVKKRSLHSIRCIFHLRDYDSCFTVNIFVEREFVLLNPKDVDDISKSYIQVTPIHGLFVL
jgi:hypothetical protein